MKDTDIYDTILEDNEKWQRTIPESSNTLMQAISIA